MASERKGRVKVGVVFGGRSAEHEVSLESGGGIMSALDPEKFEVIPILITPDGRWRLLPHAGALPDEGHEVIFPASAGGCTLFRLDGSTAAKVDVFFPMIHGTFGEDGTLQGLFELADAPFVGSGCLSSAVSMDKAAAKAILRAAGLPVLPGMTVTREEWKENSQKLREQAIATVGLPLFVKPASLGSSVGVHRVEEAFQLNSAVEDAMEYDFKVLIEEEADGIEVECGVLEDPEENPPLVSPLAQIKTEDGWYDYEAKYTPGGAEIIIPAPLPDSEADRIRHTARTAFAALGCSGLARVDFFYDESAGELYLNELNTLPGFTPVSAYPKMIEAAGISYPAMLERLIACAFSRHKKNQERHFHRLS